MNRIFSFVSKPTYAIHRPERPNGVGMVICPGGGYRDVWLDREGHDLGFRLKEVGITSLVLKYRTNSPPAGSDDRPYEWKDYLPAVESDARQAIKILRDRAEEFGLETNKIGIGGFSAGGNLALLATIYSEPKSVILAQQGMPDFTALFYPWLRDNYGPQIESRTKPDSAIRPIGPLFIINAQDDQVTPTRDCLDLYANLLTHGIRAELHIYSQGKHGFDLGMEHGVSVAMWSDSFVGWLRDSNIIEE